MQHDTNSSPPPDAVRTRFTKREFGHFLQRLGASKRQAEASAATLPPAVQRALMPLWRRLRVSWRSRHG